MGRKAYADIGGGLSWLVWLVESGDPADPVMMGRCGSRGLAGGGAQGGPSSSVG